MIIFYSGYGCKISDPEIFLGKKANVMLTYIDSLKKPHKRFLGMCAKKKQWRKTNHDHVGK